VLVRLVRFKGPGTRTILETHVYMYTWFTPLPRLPLLTLRRTCPFLTMGIRFSSIDEERERVVREGGVRSIRIDTIDCGGLLSAGGLPAALASFFSPPAWFPAIDAHSIFPHRQLPRGKKKEPRKKPARFTKCTYITGPRGVILLRLGARTVSTEYYTKFS
jgi:hypothetical protein